MATIRPNQLPAAASVSNSAAIPLDSGSAVEKGTPLQLVDAAIPLASQAEAEAGSDNSKRVTPLRVKQAIDALGVSAANLASTDEGKGAALSGYKRTGTGAQSRNVKEVLDEQFVSIEDFYDPDADDGDYVWALGRILDAGHTRVYFPQKSAGYDFVHSITKTLTENLIFDFNGQVTRFHYTAELHSRVTLVGEIIAERTLAADISARYSTSLTLAAGDGTPLAGDLVWIETSQTPLIGVPDTKQDCVPIRAVAGETLTLDEGLNFKYDTADPDLLVTIYRPVSVTMLRPRIEIVSDDAEELANEPTHLAFRLIGLRDVRVIEPIIKGSYPFTRDDNVFRNGIWFEECWGVLIDSPYVEAMSYGLGVYGGTRKVIERNATARYCHHAHADCGEFSDSYLLSGLKSSDCYQALMTHPVFRAQAETFDVRNDYGLSGWRCFGGGWRNGFIQSSVDDTAELPQFQSFAVSDSAYDYLYEDADFIADNVEFDVPNRPNKTPFGPRFGRTVQASRIKSANSMLVGFNPGEVDLFIVGPGNQLGATAAGAPDAALINATTVRADASPGRAAAVASAATLTLPIGFEVVSVTGTTAITSITATGHAGRRVTLVFADVLTFTDGGNLKLNSNFVTSADDTITLVCDGTNWFETGRSAN